MTFKEFIGNAFNWIKKAIQAVWHVFKVIVTRVIKLLTSFMKTIGAFIKDVFTDIRNGFKRIFVVKTKKSDLTGIIKKAEEENKIGIVQTSPDELFAKEETEETEYDYSLVITDNDFNADKIETISAEELDKKIGQKFYDEVSEVKLNN